GAEQAAALGAGTVALLQRAELGLADRLHRLERFDFCALLADALLLPGICAGELLLLVAEGLVDAGLEVGDLLVGRALLVLLALLELRGDPLGLGRHDLAEGGGGFLAALAAGGNDDLAGRGEDDRVFGDAGLQFGQLGLARLGGRDDLLGPGRALRLEVGLRRGELGVQLVLLAVDVGAQLVLELDQALAGLAAATLGLVLEGEERPLAGLVVDVGDDVQREVEDALEVAGADVEQDAQPRRRALEVPDVADRARELDMAHPLPTDLAPGHLDAALVADDALVPDPLVLAAVALPVLRGTEDALVEEAVLLLLERAVVDRLRLRYLALRPLPDLVRAGERDADRVEVIDLEHGSPPRHRLARRRDAVSGRGRPIRPGLHPAGANAMCGQSSNPARLIPPRS